MASIRDKIVLAFQAAEKINSALWGDGIDGSYASIEELLDHVQAHFDVKVTIYAVDVEAWFIFGFIERFSEGREATIWLVKNIGSRWLRAVGTKELCQLVLDMPEDWSTNGLDTLRRLATSTLMVELDAPENIAVRSEYLAEIVSWEILYPHEFRRRDAQALADGRTTRAALANRYKLPEELVEEILSPPYIDFCEKYWREVARLKVSDNEG